MIGDPSGRSTERNLLDGETLAAQRGRDPRPARAVPRLHAGRTRRDACVNNLDWLGELSLIDFLRDIGKHFTIPYMLAKDSVQVRLERGLSFTEFSYMLLQAYDFAHLHRTMGVELQMGGADQWGNITAGLELIRRTSGRRRRRRRRRATPGPRPRLQAAAVAVGDQVRQERGRRVGLARPGADVAVRVLPVLAEHRRPRRRHVPALVHGALARARSRRSRRRRRARPEARPAQRALALDITARTHGATAARPGDRRFRGAVLGETRSSIRPSLASLYESAGGFTFEPAWLAAGRRRAAGRGRPVRVARRGAADDRGRRRDGQRRAGRRTRRSSRSRSPGSGSTSASASAVARSAAARADRRPSEPR